MTVGHSLLHRMCLWWGCVLNQCGSGYGACLSQTTLSTSLQLHSRQTLLFLDCENERDEWGTVGIGQMSQSHTRRGQGTRWDCRALPKFSLFTWKTQSIKFTALSSAGSTTVPSDSDDLMTYLSMTYNTDRTFKWLFPYEIQICPLRILYCNVGPSCKSALWHCDDQFR